uniref:Uncharacterized protein n=1 Tax=viral metagenome TaxID=1070528 RepID=A0A6C0I391_9ZZZZ
MPYQLRKVRGKSCYSVTSKKAKNAMTKKNRATKRRVFSKCTTLEKAKKQVRLLNAIRYNPNFVPNR